MKKRQMLLAVILMLSLAFAFTPGTFAKKKAPKLNKTKITLSVGKNATLKVKNTKKKVTWKSSNKSVATVSKKGVVKAKKEGKATITAKVDGKSLKCKVTVKKQNVTPVSTNLTFIGSNEDKYEDIILTTLDEEEMKKLGLVDTDDYSYSPEVCVDIPIKFTSAKATYQTTNTKIGSYNGVCRYNIDVAGSFTFPTKAYVWKVYKDKPSEIKPDNEKVEIDIPADADTQKQLAYVKALAMKKSRITIGFDRKQTEYKDSDPDSWTYPMRDLGDTDKDFTDYVSAYTCDDSGNFTFKVYDVGIMDKYDYFGLNIGYRYY